MTRELWNHQKAGIDALRDTLRNGCNRVVLSAPCGAGKTRLAARIIEGALKKNKRVAFIVSNLSLIDQTLTSFAAEGVTDVGVIQGENILTDWSKPIQICSAQTLASKRNKGTYPAADLVIIDEVHVLHDIHKTWLHHEGWQGVPFVGLSATPGTRGLGKHFQTLLTVETTKGLIDKGLLSPFRVFATGHPDLTGVKIIAGDYHEGQLSDAMQRGTLTADIVETWSTRHNANKTLVFGVDCAHAQQIQARFVDAGITCGYQDAKTPSFERKEIKRKFHNGEYRVVANVATLTTGTDWDVRCLVLARPTQSEMLYVQIIGRALRTAPGKDYALILDHSDTTKNLGFVSDIHFDRLDMGKPLAKNRPKPKPPKPIECPKCTAIFAKGSDTCWNCGEIIPKKVSGLIERDGELSEVTAGQRPRKSVARVYTMEQKGQFYSGLLWYGQSKGYKQGWASNQYREKFGVWPRNLSEVPVEPTMDVRAFIKHRQIAWAMGRKKYGNASRAT